MTALRQRGDQPEGIDAPLPRGGNWAKTSRWYRFHRIYLIHFLLREPLFLLSDATYNAEIGNWIKLVGKHISHRTDWGETRGPSVCHEAPNISVGVQHGEDCLHGEQNGLLATPVGHLLVMKELDQRKPSGWSWKLGSHYMKYRSDYWGNPVGHLWVRKCTPWSTKKSSTVTALDEPQALSHHGLRELIYLYSTY